MLPSSIAPKPPKSARSLAADEPRSPDQQEARHDSSEDASSPHTLPHGRSVGDCLTAVWNQMGHFEHHHAEWATQLLFFLPDARTPKDIHEWLGALTPDLCEARPDLLLRLSEHLCNLPPGFPKRDLFECVERCLDIARSAKQSDAVWTRVCAGLSKLPPPAMDELPTCLQSQRKHGRLPENLERLIAHVQNVIVRLKDLRTRGFSAVPDSTRVIPMAPASIALQGNEIMAIDTGSETLVIEAPGAAANAGPTLNRDVLGLVMGHVLNEEGIDQVHPGNPHQSMDAGQAMLDLALLNRESLERFRPMLANNRWMRATYYVASNRSYSNGLIIKLINQLVDLDAEAVGSLLPCAQGMAQSRLDVVLRALLVSLTRSPRGPDGPGLMDAYSRLHDLAVVQLATQGRMSPCFAEHIALSALPLHTLTMAYRMLAHATPPAEELFASIGSSSLSAYPEEVQAQTLVGLLSLLPAAASKNERLTRLESLMRELGPWPADAPQAWLRCQWDHLSDMLALIGDPAIAFLGNAVEVPTKLLTQLHRHHGLDRHRALLIEDPFGERYVAWTVADIRLLAALCKRGKGPSDWKPPELVDCLVDLLRQLCLVSVQGEKFAAPGFMADFPAGILQSAFRRLTPREQQLVLVRNYSEDDKHIELITNFAIDHNIDLEERRSCLRAIANVAQDADVVQWVREMMRRNLQ